MSDVWLPPHLAQQTWPVGRGQHQAKWSMEWHLEHCTMIALSLQWMNWTWWLNIHTLSQVWHIGWSLCPFQCMWKPPSWQWRWSLLVSLVVQHNVQQSRLVSHLVKGLSGSRACRAKYSQLRWEEMQVYCTGEECCLSLFLIYGKLVPMVHPCPFAQKWWVKVSTISHFQWCLICVQPRTL